MDTTALTIDIYADGADIETIKKRCGTSWIKGFTTNPTLMRKAGVTSYESFAREAIDLIGDRPISLEVFADDEASMGRQAHILSSWGPNVYVKIPVTDTGGRSTSSLIRALCNDGIKLNVTAIMTPAQVASTTEAISGGTESIISVFAGRIADTGRDPVPLMLEALEIASAAPRARLLWASPRELLNLVQADKIGCHIITMTDDLLIKIEGLGRNLDDFSLDTVQMFRRDALASGFHL